MNLIEVAKSKIKEKKNVIITEGWDERVLQAVHELLDEGLMNFILIGNEDEIRAKAKNLKLELKDTKIYDAKSSQLGEKFAKQLAELRKDKGITLDKAKELVKDEQYFGTMMLYNGMGDAMGGSVICSTADFMRPVLQIIKAKKGQSLVSEVSVVYDPKRKKNFFFSDVSLNIDPTPEQLAQITLNAAEVAESFDIKPKVALLSYSTKGSGENPVLGPIRKALAIVKEKKPSLLIDGEMQVDAAIVPDAAKRKCPGSPLKGDANVLVFPNLTAGNICLHALMRFSDLEFLWPLTKGLNKPAAVFGRSVSKEIVKNVMILLAMEAQ